MRSERARTCLRVFSRISIALVLSLAFASAAFAGSISLAWDPSPNAAGYVVFYGMAPGFYTGALNVGNQTTATVRGLAGGQIYYFAIKSYSILGVPSSTSNEVSGSTTNTPPQVISPGGQASNEGVTVNLPISASDAEGDVLTYSSNDLPTGLYIDSTTGVITGTVSYSAAGSHSVTITVSDGATFTNVGFSWDVQNVNLAPLLGTPSNRSSPVGATVSLQIVASDPDGNPLTYTASGLPTGLTINTATGLVTGTLGAAGSYSVTVQVTDGLLPVTAAFSWTVLSSNQTPILAAPGNQGSSVGITSSLQLFAADFDGNTLTFAASGLPPGLVLNPSSGLITGKPTNQGVYSVTASASDGLASASRAFNWTIQPNSNPLFTPLGTQVAVEGQFVSLQLDAHDPEGQPLTYDPLLPDGLSLNDQGLITGVATFGSAGVFPVLIAVSDGFQETDITFSWTILAAPPGPPFVQERYATPQSPQTAVSLAYQAGQTAGDLNVVVVGWRDSIRHVQSVTDSKGNVYTLAVGPTVRAGFGSQSIYYAKNIVEAAAGENLITVTFDGAAVLPDLRIAEYSGINSAGPIDVVVESQGSSATSSSGTVATSATHDVLIGANLVEKGTTNAGSGYTPRVVTNPNGNILMDRVVSTADTYSATAPLSSSGQWIMQFVAFRAAGYPPTITSRTPTSGPAGTVVTLSGIDFGATQGTSSVSFNGVTASPTSWSDTTVVVPVPTGATNGDMVVTVAGVSSGSLPFTVHPALPLVLNQVSAETDTVSLALNAIDPDGHTLTYTAAGLPPGLTIDPATGVISGTLSYTTAGPYTPSVSVTDGTLSAGQSFTWTVMNLNRPPVIIGTMGNLTSVLGTNIALQAASASDPDADLLTYSATGLPPGVTIGSGGLLSGAPLVADVYNVTIFASDGDLSCSVSFVWTVSPSSISRVTFIQAHSSSVLSGPSSMTVSYPAAQIVGSLNVVVVGWSGPGAQVQSVNDVSGNAYHLAIGPTTRAEVGNQSIYYASNVGAAAAGANSVTVTFTSPAALAEVRIIEYQGIEPSNVVDITAAGTGSGSTAASTPATTTFRNDLLFGAVWASSATMLPQAGLTARLTTPSGTLLEDATVTVLGTYTVQASVAPPSPWIIQMVAFRDVNHAPTLVNPGNLTTPIGTSVSMTVNAADSDNDLLTYNATGLPQGISLNATTGAITGTPGPATAGFHSVTFTVSDGRLSVSQSFLWGVTIASGVTPLRRSDDFDGDGRSDLTVYRPSNGTWYILKSSANFAAPSQIAIPWGTSTDIQVSGDYDGDGKTDLAFFRPSTGEWRILYSSTNYLTNSTVVWGVAGDLAVPGDYDGDGRTDIAIYHPASGEWKIRRSIDGATQIVVVGISTDVPVPGDYDGDGKVDPAAYRPAIGKWQILLSSSAYATTRVVTLGSGNDLPAPADYDGDGITDVAVYRRSVGQWVIVNSTNNSTTTTSWGNSTDLPEPGDYDGDGKADLAVYRKSTGQWLIMRSSPGVTFTLTWGGGADTPAPDVIVDNSIKVQARPQASETTRRGDFDNDGRTDLTVFRPANGTWFTLKSTAAFKMQTAVTWGTSTDTPVPGDYDGDGITDPAFFRRSTGEWQIRLSRTSTTLAVTLGGPLDLAVPADYDGDGRTDVAIYHPPTGEWKVRLSSTGAMTTIATWGWPTDIPVPGDYDGDGKADAAVYRPVTGEWQILLSSSAYVTSQVVTLGSGSDVPVPGDYDGDGKTDVAIYHVGQWKIVLSSTGATTTIAWGGSPVDIPVPGDYDGDGKIDLAVYRNTTWFVLESHTNYKTQWNVVWGASTDRPGPNLLVANAATVQARRKLVDGTRAADFDADRRADITVYRPSNGTWFMLRSSQNYAVQPAIVWGTSTDIPVAGDYDGDGKADPAFYRPSTGQWKILYSSTNYATNGAFTLGVSGDLPVPGDYDGDGKTDVAVYRSTTGEWQVLLSSTGTTTTTVLGSRADVPVPGDYDGDGKTDLAVYRPGTGQWRIRRSGTGVTVSAILGSGTDLPVPADYDGDGRADIAIFHRATAQWQILNSGNGTTTTTTWGTSIDLPVPADYDGDGKADLAVYHGQWQIRRSTNGTTQTFSWGISTDRPVSSITVFNGLAVQARPRASVGTWSLDMDGDGRIDATVYRPSDGTWYTRTSQSNFVTLVTRPWGTSTDLPVPGDYDGDGKTDPAFYRPSTGQWQILLSSTGFATSRVVTLGAPKDLPVPGDYDGDGLTDEAVYQPLTGTWLILPSSTNTVVTIVFGTPQDIPVPADYDGDGITDLAYYRPSLGQWVIANSHSALVTTASLGTASDIPVPGDYDGDGKTDLAVYHAGQWQFISSSTGTTTTKTWGISTDVPVPGDYDGDGKTDLAVYRSGSWFVLESHTNYTTQWSLAFGTSTDRPGPNTGVANALSVLARPRLNDAMRASDVDGDGVADISVYQPSTGTWATLTSLTDFTSSITRVSGTSTDVPVPGDYDRDGKADPAFYRSSTGEWMLPLSSTNFLSTITVPWGAIGDIPVPGDYDGDGKTDLAVYRPSTGEWRVLTSSSNYVTSIVVPWGTSTDRPVPGDYDGDGKTDLAFFRPSTGQWQVLFSASGYATNLSKTLGIGTDLVVPGDYDGDGKTDIAIYRPSTGTWSVLFAKTNFTTSKNTVWGSSTDKPVVVDVDGDGKADLALYTTTGWTILLSGSNYTTTLSTVWGTASDIPLPPQP